MYTAPPCDVRPGVPGAVEVVRPVAWTALLGGALFAGSRAGRFRLTRRLGLTFLGVVALHGLWDASYGWAIMFANGASGAGWELTWPNTQAWIGLPSDSALVLFNVFYNGLLGINALIGTAWIVLSWRRYGDRGAPARATVSPQAAG